MRVIGIDPGWASCGFCVNSGPGRLMAGDFVPRDKGLDSAYPLLKAIIHLQGFVEHESKNFGLPEAVYMERYVAYKGIHSDMSESILMFIGALKYHFENLGIPVNMVRAIDWKPKVCKYLVRTKGFNNPYPSFDKKYSILAAKTLSGTDFKSDHTADAVCLSYLGEIDKYNMENKK